eukprot:TRINITY_DN5395_c0_g1_i1.p1 TRINITY_DN5395_c0_g1~~TRINITY_DN5395_c0_g1_i1.p1  ORF type:complete len:202 (+),score=83.29 TRINITY_DN5395_c0_g1_i1:25-606(+)
MAEQLPCDWNAVFGELLEGFTRPEMLQLAQLFMKVANGNSVIDSFQMKMAQEKIDAKTHVQMTEYLAAMQKAGRDAKIAFRDWVQLQGMVQNRKLKWAGGRAGFIPPVEVTKATVTDDQSQGGKKAFFEKLASEQKQVADREAALKQPSAAIGKRRAKEEEEERKRAEEEQKEAERQRRKAFMEKQRTQFEQH